MAITRISKSFKDISLSFKPHPVTKDLQILKNENAIRRAVRNLVETIPSERFFQSDLGTNIRGLLFDFVDYGTASAIETQIYEVIYAYEPRVDNVAVLVTPRPDQNEFEVSVQFDIVGQSVTAQEFTFILEATR
jgi:phage baseplate assembly protein W